MRPHLCFRTMDLKVFFESSRLGVWLENLGGCESTKDNCFGRPKRVTKEVESDLEMNLLQKILE